MRTVVGASDCGRKRRAMRSCQSVREQWPGQERSGGAGVVVQMRRKISGECDCRDARAQGTDADTARTATKSTKSRDDAKDTQEGGRGRHNQWHASHTAAKKGCQRAQFERKGRSVQGPITERVAPRCRRFNFSHSPPRPTIPATGLRCFISLLSSLWTRHFNIHACAK